METTRQQFADLFGTGRLGRDIYYFYEYLCEKENTILSREQIYLDTGLPKHRQIEVEKSLLAFNLISKSPAEGRYYYHTYNITDEDITIVQPHYQRLPQQKHTQIANTIQHHKYSDGTIATSTTAFVAAETPFHYEELDNGHYRVTSPMYPGIETIISPSQYALCIQNPRLLEGQFRLLLRRRDIPHSTTAEPPDVTLRNKIQNLISQLSQSSGHVENDTDCVENDTGHVENDTDCVENDTGGVENDTPIENGGIINKDIFPSTLTPTYTTIALSQRTKSPRVENDTGGVFFDTPQYFTKLKKEKEKSNKKEKEKKCVYQDNISSLYNSSNLRLEERKEKEKINQKEKEKKEEISENLAPIPNLIKPTTTPNPTPQVKEVVEKWNQMAQRCGLSRVIKITDRRIAGIKRRLQDPAFDYDLILDKISKSDFLLGLTTSWKCDFDFIFLSDHNWVKILEGKYDNRTAVFRGAYRDFAEKARRISEYVDREFNRSTSEG